MLKGNITGTLELALLVAPRRSVKESLTNILLEGGDNLTVYAFDGEAYVKTESDIPCTDSAAIPAQKLASILRNADEVDIKKTKTGVTVKSAGVKYTIQTPEPELPKPDKFDGESTTMAAADFQAAVDGTSFAVDDATGRFALAGVEITIAGDVVSFVGTDGKRLACWKNGDIQPGGVVCPVKYLRHAAKVAGSTVEITLSDNLTRIKTGKHEVVFMNVSGRFPNWSALLETGNRVESKIDPESFLGAARKATALSSESSIDFILGEKSRIECSDSEGSTVADIDGEFEDYQAKFNGTYLIDSLARFKGSVQMFTGTEKESMILKSGNLTHVLMPVHG